MSEPGARLQRPCMMCGSVVELPAVWACPCGAWRLCHRPDCHLTAPRRHRDWACGQRAKGRKPLLTWLPAREDDLSGLSAGLRLIWVAADRAGASAREGHAAGLPSSVSVLEALVDYEAGPGAGRGVATARWQVWDRGRMGASGDTGSEGGWLRR